LEGSERVKMDEDDRKPAAVDLASTRETSNTPSKEVKPALKREREKKKNRDKQLKWDEAAIDEHNELRGTRMNIDEPKTPYIYYDSGAESDDSRRMKSPANERSTLSWDHLQSRLDSVAAVRDQYPSSPSDYQVETDHSDVEDETRNEMRKLEFLEHRKRHYNEFELVKKFRAEHDDEDEEDNDDEKEVQNKTTDGNNDD
jgi:protein phosphatase inhibitor 2